MKLATQFLVLILTLLCGLQAHAERTTTFFHTDGLGSVVAATDQSGAVLWRKDYAPYGEQIDSTPDSESIAYTGKQHDDVTGLTYFGARYYDPEIGRFLSVDPVGFVESNPMSFNRYAYVNNNPYKYVDPDGEFLNFAAKFVLDVGVNMAFNYVTTGELNVGGALKESAIGILNPAKTVATAGKLVKALNMGCKLSCFVAGTTVLTERGYVPIETLKEGDLVWAHDPETGETALKPIVRTFVNTNDTVWDLVIEKDGVRYRHQVTGSHPYYVVDLGWVEVAHLQAGATFLTEGGKTALLESVEDTGEIVATYNFEVADINTYYVTAAKVLVHNCGGSIVNKGGRFSDLNKVKNSDEVAHHMPQDAFNRVNDISRSDGPAIGMTLGDHAKTRTYAGRGRVTMAEDARLGARQRMAKDVRDLRANFGTKYNKGALEAIKYAKTRPEFRK